MRTIIFTFALLAASFAAMADTPVIFNGFMIAEITGDNVNLRSQPSASSPIATYMDKDWQGKPTWEQEQPKAWKGERIFVKDATPDWWQGMRAGYYDTFYVNKKFCKPIETTGFGDIVSGRIYVYADTIAPAPEDDEPGCWQPTVVITYIYPGGDCVVEQTFGFDNGMRFGKIENGLIHYNYTALNQNALFETPGNNISADVYRDSGLTFRFRPGDYVTRFFPELSGAEELFMMYFTKDNWKSIISDLDKYGVSSRCDVYVFKEDLDKAALHFYDKAK